jgi:RHS repeat-associated protein
MTYDVLGRMTTRTDSAGTAQWVYDLYTPGGWATKGTLSAMVGAPDPNLKGACTIPNTTQTSGNRAGRSYLYTQFGELAEVDECVDGETFSTTYQYDDTHGRQSGVTYPQVNGATFAVAYNYTSLGFLQSVTDASDNKVYWAAKSTNAAGQVIDEFTRNGVETVSTRNPSTGWLLGATTTAVADNNTVIQQWNNTFDEAGNLRSRSRSQPANMADSTETFEYDILDRVTSSTLASGSYQATEGFDYDYVGNLTQKGQKSLAYTGCAAGGGPHTICSVDGGSAYSYDLNGNMVAGNSRSVSYNAANKVVHIQGQPATGDGPLPTVDFAYGADRLRVVQSVGTQASATSDPVESARTVYVGMGGTGKTIYERTQKTSADGSIATEHVQFIYAASAHGGNAFALRVSSTTTQPSMRYQHFDHLGSVTASTDENGKVVGATGGADTTVYGYDVWGARRNPDGTQPTAPLNLQAGHREYTGHETIPSVGLVNMNGRVYDPDLGRFLSPDPNIQFVADLQSYNRYTYAANNPLKYTDPTGYFLGSDFDMMINFTIAAAGIASCAYTGGAGCAMAFAVLGAAYNTASAINSGVAWDQAVAGNIAGFAVGMFMGEVGGGVVSSLGGSPVQQIIGGAASGAVTSGVMTEIGGGGHLGQNILTGALSGAIAAAFACAANQAALSEADVDQQQGGGGSGADKLEALLKTRVMQAGASWDWANSSSDLFNADQTGFSDEFVQRMQPVMDKLQLNVDLAKVSFDFGGPTNYTVGYHITLQGGALENLSFDDVLGASLHELGHVVQFQNGNGIMARLAGEIRQMEGIRQGRLIPENEVLPANLDKSLLYEQDPYLKEMSLQQLGQTRLLGSWTLDSQADRFRDLLLAR